MLLNPLRERAPARAAAARPHATGRPGPRGVRREPAPERERPAPGRARGAPGRRDRGRLGPRRAAAARRRLQRATGLLRGVRGPVRRSLAVRHDEPDAIDHLLARGCETVEPPTAWPPQRRELDVLTGLEQRRLRLSDHAPVEATLPRAVSSSLDGADQPLTRRRKSQRSRPCPTRGRRDRSASRHRPGTTAAAPERWPRRATGSCAACWRRSTRCCSRASTSRRSWTTRSAAGA